MDRLPLAAALLFLAAPAPGCGFRSGLDGTSTLSLQAALLDRETYLQGSEGTLLVKILNEGPSPVAFPSLFTKLEIDGTDVTGDYDALAVATPASLAPGELVEVELRFVVNDFAKTGTAQGYIAISPDESLPIAFHTTMAATLDLTEVGFSGTATTSCTDVGAVKAYAVLTNVGTSGAILGEIAFQVKDAGTADLTPGFEQTPSVTNPTLIAAGETVTVYADLLPLQESFEHRADALLWSLTAEFVDETTLRARPDPVSLAEEVPFDVEIPATLSVRARDFVDELTATQSTIVDVDLLNSGSVEAQITAIRLEMAAGTEIRTGDYSVAQSQASPVFPWFLAPADQFLEIPYDVALMNAPATSEDTTVTARVEFTDPVCGPSTEAASPPEMSGFWIAQP